MTITIRQELSQDYAESEEIIKSAFEREELSDQTEHILVSKLRKSPAFVPELSLVAIHEDNIVGHILLSKIQIKNEEEVHASLALAPVSVHPDFQGNGIGAQLIMAVHQKAKSLGFTSIVLLGHAEYYPRFGYKRASHFGIELPFGAPDENCMAIELVKDGLKQVYGKVHYDPSFYN